MDTFDLASPPQLISSEERLYTVLVKDNCRYLQLKLGHKMVQGTTITRITILKLLLSKTNKYFSL